jgi:hypothetical protein
MGVRRTSFEGQRFLGRRLAAIAAALVLGLGLAIAPSGARPALAADPLKVRADATYTLDPAAGKVHVVIDWEVTDLKRNSGGFIYYYTGYRFAVQPEARSIKAAGGGASLAVSTKKHEFYIDTTVDFRTNLYYGQTSHFTVRYDLVAGAPRSESPVRIGRAFATFGVWAWGDSGKGSVEVRTPQGFGSTIDGGPMSIASDGGKQTLRAKPEDPATFYAIISAENPLAYTTDRLSLEGEVEIVINAWPEDHKWDDLASSTLRTALPELQKLIGLPWPVEHDLAVRERYTPSLEGYAGVFFTESERIDISEDLDPVVMVHEASHAWLNENLFIERWIYEGLAQDYAYRAQKAVGGEDGGLPERPAADDTGHVLLSSWTFPEVIRDQKTDDQERYGYQASFWVIHRLVENAGVDGMRVAFAAADAHTTAYPGAGTPEKVAESNNWKRLVDLVESLARDDSTDTERALKDFVLTSTSADELRDREDARKAYRDLLAAGTGWLPGWYVRKPMDEWKFEVATKHMAEATAVLGLRDQVDAAAGALQLQPDGALKTAYEGAEPDLDAATTLAQDELAALAAISDAKAKVDVAPDLLATLGLLGEAPQVPYDAARSAFEAGDIAGAKTNAATAAALVAGAAAAGQQRLVLIVAVAVALVVLLIVLAIVVRRRGRRRVRAAAMAMPAAGGGEIALSESAAPEAATPAPEAATPAPEVATAAPEAATPEPYATLADPGAAPFSEGPDAEGGAARGDSPADPGSPSIA